MSSTWLICVLVGDFSECTSEADLEYDPLADFSTENNPPQKILPKGEEDEALASACACSKVGSRI